AVSRQPYTHAADDSLRGSSHSNGDGSGPRTCGARRNNPVCQDNVDPGIQQQHGKLRQAGDISVAPLREEYKIASLHPAVIGEAAQERLKLAFGRWRGAQEADASHPLLLRARRERPCRRAAQQHDERAPFHSMSSSASNWIELGTSMPSALAVCRLMTSANFVDCSTGRSAGLAPLRI